MKHHTRLCCAVTLVAAFFLIQPRLTSADPTPPPDDPKAATFVCGMVALGIGVVVVIGLIHMCRNIQAADNNPGAPPNEPPVVTGGIDGGSIGIILGLKDASNARDISAFNISDPLAPAGVTYKILISFGIQSSTNLLDWSTETRATGWVSSAGMFFAYYQNGSNVMNTYSLMGTTNRAPISIGTTNEAKRYFRMVQ